jgi:hypothetical protein
LAIWAVLGPILIPAAAQFAADTFVFERRVGR